MASQKTIEEILRAIPLGARSLRKTPGYWQAPKMIDRAYDYSKKKHKKVTKDILILDHGSGLYHAIEKIYKKFNNYLIQRGVKVNMKKPEFINRKIIPKKKISSSITGSEKKIDYNDGKEHWNFKDACEGYKLLRRDSKVPISEHKYGDYYGREAMKSALIIGSYLKFREFNEKSILEEKILR